MNTRQGRLAGIIVGILLLVIVVYAIGIIRL
jgi:hypothetical protein